jgi:hypothetical protein
VHACTLAKVHQLLEPIKHENLEMIQSASHRDDWLHRGIMLRDIDYYHYSRYIARIEMPRSRSAQNLLFLRCALPACKDGELKACDSHLNNSYALLLRRRSVAVTRYMYERAVSESENPFKRKLQQVIPTDTIT